MSDQELDNLFKEAAEGFKAPSEESAWQDMASKLDQAGTSAPSFWNWKTVTSSVVISGAILSLILFFATKDIQTSDEKITNVKLAESAAVQNKISDSTGVTTNNQDGDKQIVKEEKSEANTREIGSQKNAIKSKQQVENEPAQSPVLSQYKNRVKTNDSVPLKGTKSQKAVELPSSIVAQEVVKNDISPVEQNSVTNKQNNASSIETVKFLNATGVTRQTEHKDHSTDQSTVFSNNTRVNEDLLTQTDSLVREEKETLPDSLTSDPKSEQDQKEENRKSKGAISLKVAIAPDFSSVKYFDSGKPGINYGMLVGYVFNNRWSVYSGVISSRKIYSSTRINESYTNSGGHDYPIKKLDGDCRILDIPLNVYYTFFPERSLSLKAGIGFSSYVMLQEDYLYYVDNPYGSDVYDQNIRHENNDWFKMLNVSVILQKKVSNKLSIEFEPFLKAPLAGVGEGEVSLVSLGAFLNVMYTIPLQKNDNK